VEGFKLANLQKFSIYAHTEFSIKKFRFKFRVISNLENYYFLTADN